MIRHLFTAIQRAERTSVGDVAGALLIFVILFIAAGWASVLQVAP
jgi:hypothetical protein